ncbi:hypothetical protein SDC9_204811 [bioreactor metagenome]|uniref:Uncharacterized protein n=1 Tax=bioreactor metagenome TaxID=1076179 RepID=A0A645J137_9ZZZZ
MHPSGSSRLHLCSGRRTEQDICAKTVVVIYGERFDRIQLRFYSVQHLSKASIESNSASHHIVVVHRYAVSAEARGSHKFPSGISAAL